MSIELKGAKVLVVGLKKSGMASVEFLHGRGAAVSITDLKGLDQLPGGNEFVSHLGIPFRQQADETFPTITPHSLRHSAASLAVSAGANVKAVQRMLGHAKASMTLDVYADLFDDDLDVVADRLDTAIIKTSTTRKTSKQITADPLRTGSENGTKNRL